MFNGQLHLLDKFVGKEVVMEFIRKYAEETVTAP